VRGFNLELQDRVEEATADLARKNRELAELNQLLMEARRERSAQERLAALGQLSGTIAHELGNPLNAISGHVQLLARDPACPPAVRVELQVIEREVQRMTSIIRRFLDSARALVPRPEPVQLAALLEEALSLNVSAEARHRIEVRRDLPADLGPASIDPSLVRHVVGNFISNAVDAMPAGGSLTVRARRAGDQLALSVTDTGAGIAPDARKHIFEPFFTTKEAGKGTGLGLAICREIASALRGRIEVESSPGAGATFTLLLPVPPSPAAAPRRPDRIPPWTPPASWWWTTTCRAGSCSPASSPPPATGSPRSRTAGKRWRRSTPATPPISSSPTSAWPRWTASRSSTPTGSAPPTPR
jgi:signal transduction histidine kinase